ncbi:acetyl-CoA hydrolase/transferase C-terminal domain-containing protein [Natronorubrum sulfidifaciens]|uniref:Succinate CoA transferase n=1 Tax=Natronorubrum sulfidifaciens JCM 14089 TaxID=1230460 RepID=L9VXJ3_9EURY|nr:acetyl-CoA hydrolase/transferase C-terminal domain-containing protein [Natronorubrum sulfidifaciens]ELY40958.1 succinate CoA transferase [Natronorubrum sulfidifaciens JCM 14089]
MSDRLEGAIEPVDVETAASHVDSDAVVAVSGFGAVGYPKALPLALADDDRDLELTVVSGGSVGKEIDTALVETGAIARRYPYQSRPAAREAVNDGTIAYQDRFISAVGDEVALGHLPKPDVAIVEAVAVGADWFVPSLSIGHTAAYVRAAPKLIIEVNGSIPREIGRFHDVYERELPPNRKPIPLEHPADRIGDSRIRFDTDTLLAVVETETPDDPYSFREPSATDREIATNLATVLEAELERCSIFDDRIALQFGVGSLGNALMGALSDIDFGDRDVYYYGEVFQDGLLEMIENGTLTGASATSFALSVEGQRRLFDDIDRYSESVILRTAALSNSPALIDRFGVVGINSAVEVDLYGHVNSTHVGGSRVLNGVGGSGDFNRNSPLTITTLPSRHGTETSCLVPMCPHVDHTEHDISVVITEQGIADLRGRSPRERSRLLIEECAHPQFVDDLEAYLERSEANGGHIPHHLESAFFWQS